MKCRNEFHHACVKGHVVALPLPTRSLINPITKLTLWGPKGEMTMSMIYIVWLEVGNTKFTGQSPIVILFFSMVSSLHQLCQHQIRSSEQQTSMEVAPTVACHVVAMPYPARGHINPLLNFCKLLIAINNTHIIVTFVLTEEWLRFIASDDPAPANIRFATIPNVIPSELVRGADQVGFMEAIMTKMEAPFEQLLHRLEPPPTIIVHDSFLFWAVDVGNRRNIPVASFWTMSASIFSVLHHHHLLEQNSYCPLNLSGDDDKISFSLRFLKGKLNFTNSYVCRKLM